MSHMQRRINPAHIEQIKEMTSGSPYYSLLGIRLVEIASGYCKMEMQIDPQKHMNPFGSVHGGAYASMIDCAAYWATYCDRDEDAGCTTLDLSVNNLSMAREGKLTVVARAVKEGRSVCLSTAEIRDENNRLIAFGTSKLLMLERKQTIDDALRSSGFENVPPKFLND